MNSGPLDIIGSAISRFFSGSAEILWVCDYENRHFYVSDQFKVMCGYGLNYKISDINDFFNLVYLNDRAKIGTFFSDLFESNINDFSTVIKVICGDGGKKKIVIKGIKNLLPLSTSEEKTVLSGTIYLSDENKKHDSQLNHALYYDSVTGLPSRMMFVYRANVSISRCRENCCNCAVLFFDLINFKRINDFYGFDVGDTVLKIISSVIQHEINGDEYLARPGGDEFLVLIPNPTDIIELESKVGRIVKKVNERIYIGDKVIQLSANCGISVYPKDGLTADELVKNAETAMYKAKTDGKLKWCFYDESIKKSLIKRNEIESSMQKGFDNEEFYIVYQPLINTIDKTISGVEALMRWESAENGLISPVDFIPIAEDTGIILPLGIWMLQQTCYQFKHWYEKYHTDMRLCVNISSIQLNNQNFYDTIIDILENTQMPPNLLELEITESILIQDYNKIALVLQKLRERGIRLSLDDFGTGYSSFNYLKHLPLDTLKIDKSFVMDLNNSSNGKAIVSSIIELAHILNLDVIAEGVETAEQFDCLKGIGCHNIQGYYISRPVKAEVIENGWLKKKYPVSLLNRKTF